MNRGKPPEEPRDEHPERMSAAELKVLVAAAKGQPERITALVRRMVLQTIDEVRECLDEGAREKPPEPQL